MIIVGLTGSIGMGKSTAAAMFAEEGAVVWNADDTVHQLYSIGGAAVGPVGEAFPGVVVNGAIDRPRLAQVLGRDDAAFKRLEHIVHPLVARGRAADLEAARERGVRLAVLDIPLLFEGGGDEAMDVVVVVSAGPDLQRTRVLARPGMTEERFAAILERQTPDVEKRRRADFVVDTSQDFEAMRVQVRRIVKTILSPDWVSSRARV